jgi:hypothetical protein
MPRTYLRKKRKSKRRTRKGGGFYYYPYNKNPLLFTEPSDYNRTMGNWKGGDPRSTIFPDIITNMARSIQYNSQASTNAFLGKAPPVNPSVTSQPINK